MQEAALEEQIRCTELELLQALNTDNPQNVNTTLPNKLELLKNEQQMLRQPKIQGLIMRSRAEIYEMAENRPIISVTSKNEII